MKVKICWIFCWILVADRRRLSRRLTADVMADSADSVLNFEVFPGFPGFPGIILMEYWLLVVAYTLYCGDLVVFGC